MRLSLVLFLLFALTTLSAKTQSVGNFARSSDRIIDGSPVDTGDAPWSASLQYNGSHLCGGTLISPVWNRSETSILRWSSDDTMPVWLITAAHCLIDANGNYLDTQKLAVFSGSHEIGSEAGEFQKVEHFAIHPDYDDFLVENDIAVMRLSQPSKGFLPRQRASIRLPHLQETVWLNRPSVPYVVAGWGRVNFGGALSTELLEVTLPRANKDQCQLLFDQFGFTLPLGTFCAGFLAGSQDSCQGDSGGGVFYRPPKNPARFSWTSTPVYVGSVTWGIGCGSTEVFGVYTSIFPYEEWITKYIESNPS